MNTAVSPVTSAIAAVKRCSETGDDLYRIWFEGRLMMIETTGFWDMAVVDAYIADTKLTISRLRNLNEPLRAIVDRRGAPVLAMGVADRLSALYSELLKPGDRVAVLVDSSLVKMQIGRMARDGDTQAFLSLSTAKTWVLAY